MLQQPPPGFSSRQIPQVMRLSGGLAGGAPTQGQAQGPQNFNPMVMQQQGIAPNPNLWADKIKAMVQALGIR